MSEILRDYTIGIMDGLTVPISVSAGLVASDAPIYIVKIAVLAEIIAGAVSMSIATYDGADTVKNYKNTPWKTGMRAGIGYIAAGSLALIAYTYANNVLNGLYIAIILNLITLILFGIYKSKYLEEPLTESILKSLLSGALAMSLTYIIIKNIK